MEIVTIILSAVGAAGIAAVGYLKARAAGESFLLPKFLQTVGIGAVVGVGIGVSGGQITDTAVSQQVTAIASLGMGGFVTYLIETFGKYIYRGETAKTTTTTTTEIVSIPVPESTTETPLPKCWSPGFTVSPSFQRGLSPMIATLYITGGMDAAGKRVSVHVDWKDNSPVEIVTLDAATGKATISHTHRYQQGTNQYTGRSFYPEFTIVSSDGTRQKFNTENKCCEIEVQTE